MKKPRTDRSENALTEPQQAQLADWLLGGMGYIQAGELAHKEFGVKIGKNAMMRFYHEVCTPAVLGRRARSAKMAGAVRDEISRRPGHFDEATIDLIQQKAFDCAANPNADPEDVKSLVTLILKVRDQNLAEKKVSLDAEKLQLELRKYQDAIAAAQRELNTVKTTGGIAPETLAKVEEALKLL